MGHLWDKIGNGGLSEVSGMKPVARTRVSCPGHRFIVRIIGLVVDFHVSCHFMDTYVVWSCFASGARAPSPLTLCLPAGNWAAL